MSELENAYEQTRLDHERESRFNREVQMHEIKLMEDVTRMQNVMVRLFSVSFVNLEIRTDMPALGMGSRDENRFSKS